MVMWRSSYHSELLGEENNQWENFPVDFQRLGQRQPGILFSGWDRKLFKVTVALRTGADVTWVWGCS